MSSKNTNGLALGVCGVGCSTGQESSNGAVSSHAGCVLRQRTWELARVLLVKIFAIGLWSWFCVFVTRCLDAFISLEQWMSADSEARPHEHLSLNVISTVLSSSSFHYL